MPQSINKYGTYGVRAKGDAEAARQCSMLSEQSWKTLNGEKCSYICTGTSVCS